MDKTFQFVKDPDAFVQLMNMQPRPKLKFKMNKLNVTMNNVTTDNEIIDDGAQTITMPSTTIDDAVLVTDETIISQINTLSDKAPV